MTGINLL